MRGGGWVRGGGGWVRVRRWMREGDRLVCGS